MCIYNFIYNYIIFFIILLILFFIILLNKNETFSKEFFGIDKQKLNIEFIPCQGYIPENNNVLSGKILPDNTCSLISTDENGVRSEKILERGSFAQIDSKRIDAKTTLWTLSKENIFKPPSTNVIGGELSDGTPVYICLARIDDKTKSIPGNGYTDSVLASTTYLNKYIPGFTFTKNLDTNIHDTCTVIHENRIFEYPTFKWLITNKKGLTPDNAFFTNLYAWQKVE